MSKYRGLFTFDKDSHKYVTLPQTDGIIDLLDTDDYVPTEPLIKDEKIRKAVKVWAEASDIGVVRVIDDYCFKDSESDACIRFYDKIGVYLEGNYTIAELCGEEE